MLIFGMYVSIAEYETLLKEAEKAWELEDDKEIYDDYDEFEELYLHRKIFPE